MNVLCIIHINVKILCTHVQQYCMYYYPLSTIASHHSSNYCFELCYRVQYCSMLCCAMQCYEALAISSSFWIKCDARSMKIKYAIFNEDNECYERDSGKNMFFWFFHILAWALHASIWTCRSIAYYIRIKRRKNKKVFVIKNGITRINTSPPPIPIYL